MSWRYTLTRELGAGPTACFVMLNPSTADAEQDDPTIRRTIGFARSLGFGRLEVVNLFALRATRPAELKAHLDPVGPDNDRHLLEAARRAHTVVCAWGVHGAHRGRDRQVLELLDRPLHCLGLTKAGHPRHPLYLRKDTALRAFARTG